MVPIAKCEVCVHGLGVVRHMTHVSPLGNSSIFKYGRHTLVQNSALPCEPFFLLICIIVALPRTLPDNVILLLEKI